MSKEIPFDMPVEILNRIRTQTEPVWTKYARGWSEHRDEPMGLAALSQWGARMEGLALLLDGLHDRTASNDSAAGVSLEMFALSETLQALMSEFYVLLNVAVSTFPFDPVVQRRLRETPEAGAPEANSSSVIALPRQEAHHV